MRDAVGNINSVLVLGGASEIATETVKALRERRCAKVILAVRSPDKVLILSSGATPVQTRLFASTLMARRSLLSTPEQA